MAENISMRIFKLLAFVLAISLLVASTTSESIFATSAAQNQEFEVRVSEEVEQALVEDGEVEVIVELKNFSSAELSNANRRSSKRAEENRILDEAGSDIEKVRELSHLPAMVVKVNQNELEELKTDQRIVSIVENAPLKLSSARPLLNDALDRLNAEAVFNGDPGYTGAGERVVVIDNGVVAGHPFFGDSVVQELCFISHSGGCPNNLSTQIGPGAAAPFNDEWHGTHVTGIVAGRTGVNANPQSGVAPEVDIVAVNIFAQNQAATMGDLVSGLNWVIANPTDVAAVNLSLGDEFPQSGSCDSRYPTLTTAINTLRSAGIATIAASGNESDSNGISAPACISSAISVGSTSKTSTGIAASSNSSQSLDLLAPGMSIISADAPSGYAFSSGTSMAAPMISGAFALLREAYPAETVNQLLTRLQSSGVEITDPRNNVKRSRPDISQAISFSTPSTPAAPANVNVSIKAGFATLSWPATHGAISYRITNSSGSLIKTVTNSSTSTNVNTAYGASNRFGVRAVTTMGQSPVAYTTTFTGLAGPAQDGYAFFASNGAVVARGSLAAYSRGPLPGLNRPVVGGAISNKFNGGWSVASDGGIFTFGNAQFYGSTGSFPLNQPIVGMASTPSGEGYWLVARDGGIFSFGDAQFYGSTGSYRLNQPIVGMASTPNGKGYWLVASDGGIFAFGNAQFYGSTGSYKLNQPIVGMKPTLAGSGYWLFASDGGVFSFGNTQFLGSGVGLGYFYPRAG